jgi:hypothetical protein
VREAISSTVRPARNARLKWNTRSHVGIESFERRTSRGSSGPPSSRPSRPISSDRIAFPSASAKVRPIAIASPTDFIWIVNRGSALGNFSNVQRGIFTTT